MAQNYPTTVVQNLSKYLEKVHTGGGYTPYHFYRGQEQDWPLIPKIFRGGYLPQEFKRWGDFENDLVSRFRSLAIPYLKLRFSHKLEWLTFGQHHGLPTRLLDWTENPLTALFFALENLGNENDSVVWKLKVSQVYYLDEGGIGQLGQRHDSHCLIVPQHLTYRHTSQRAAFTVHPRPLERSSFIPFEEVDATRDGFSLEKFVIPAEYRNDIRLEIDQIGIDHFSVFNDLDHLCQMLEWKIERERLFGSQNQP